MSRSLSRHHKAVARARKRRIVAYFNGDWIPKKPWLHVNRMCMVEPGYWVHEFMTRPARARDAHTCRLILAGRDPDEFVWGDNRKPHKYYW
jgi:hypothetical protein